MKSGRNLFIGVPTHNSWVRTEAFDGLRNASPRSDKVTVIFQPGTLLPYVFNILLCGAANSQKEFGWNRFSLHHNDVSTEPAWADVLMDEMDRVDADMMSVVVPIKDTRGLTSTGLVSPENGSIRRLTMKEIYRLPETFDGDIATRGLGAKEGSRLAVNSGLFVCNFDKIAPLLRKGMCFAETDTIHEEPDGTLTPWVLSEDWVWSKFCLDNKLRVFATRKVPVTHHDGKSAYDNKSPCGEWETDLGDLPKDHGQVKKASGEPTCSPADNQVSVNGDANGRVKHIEPSPSQSRINGWTMVPLATG